MSLDIWLRTLDTDLQRGNMDAASARVKRLLDPAREESWEESQEEFRDELRALTEEPVTSIPRICLATAVSQVLAYLGRNPEGRQWMQPWTKDGLVTFPVLVPVRARLLMVEHAYAARQFSASARMASEVLLQCDRERDAWGVGEAAFYLARSQMRLHDVNEVYRSCERAIESFTSVSGAEAAAVHWRVGLVLLVSGFAGWQAGHDSALTKLLSARSHLIFSGDSLARAHVEQSIGCVYRSRHEASSFDSADDAFKKAAAIYQKGDNPVHIARVLTNIGRTYFDQGKWPLASKYLLDALAQTGAIPDHLEQQRHRAETLVYLSWLRMRGQPRNLAEAKGYAAEAKTCAKESVLMTIEALLAEGSCALAAREFSVSQAAFDEALRRATEVGLSKLIAHANLCLAELLCSAETTDVGQAMEHWRSADKVLAGISSRYLRDKAKFIRSTIEKDSLIWMVTRDELLSAVPEGQPKDNRFKRLRKSLDRWALDRLEEKKELSASARAKLAGVSPSGYLQKKRAHDKKKDS